MSRQYFFFKLFLIWIVVTIAEGKTKEVKKEDDEKTLKTRFTTLQKEKVKTIHRTDSGFRRAKLTRENEKSLSQYLGSLRIFNSTLFKSGSVSPSLSSFMSTSKLQGGSMNNNITLFQSGLKKATNPVLTSPFAHKTPSLFPQSISTKQFAQQNNLFQNGIETEKVLPINYIKYDMKLIPKYFKFLYSKTPDVHVSHLHYHQGVNPCQNGGIMVQSPAGYSCVCRKQFTGKHCQERDKCYPNPCKNGGNCIDHGTHFQCRCGHKYRGLICDILNTCINNPCEHGATCLDLVNDFKCICSLGYKGKFCEEFDYCNPNPCKNGGTCSGIGVNITCSCLPQYKGKRCEVKKVCLPNPCRNNGNCIEEKSSDPCECMPGFNGKYCQENVCKPSPCYNGGNCSFEKSPSSSTWLPICKCSSVFKGKKCEIPNPCAENPGPCSHGSCSDTYNSPRADLSVDHYVCTCDKGYMGSQCDVRICDKCSKNATCRNDECVCNDGFHGDGFECQKLPDPCNPNPC